MFTSVAFLGSRGLSISFAPLVSSVVAALAAAGVHSFSVGCARGADALARSALSKHGLSFQFFSVSAFPASSYRAALVLRSRAVVASVAPDGAVVAFVASHQSPGSFGALAHARRLDLPTFVFLCGVQASALPSFGGAWLPTSLCGLPCIAWSRHTAQASQSNISTAALV